MTNKLPEVGKRYRMKKLNNRIVEIITIERVNLDRGTDFLVKVRYEGSGLDATFDLPKFQRAFEELPDQEPTKEDHIVDTNKMVLSDEVKEAMEDLKKSYLMTENMKGE